ncbi:MAG: hypothetical protein AVDCRST_MAG05-4387 [uncultured Rubrobacteraceae bacterium]|uniref:Uncharacterized protein n=1 Tax=uncultured Rubrobacteraceae bacterium TaxID=349277 RepID=A0A6J4TU92_9ACTN|nr:MAG: hypothetical protein AVDCRST_MAG05-4387 [uncultured Rubrobacteraceae bacterium]
MTAGPGLHPCPVSEHTLFPEEKPSGVCALPCPSLLVGGVPAPSGGYRRFFPRIQAGRANE